MLAGLKKPEHALAGAVQELRCDCSVATLNLAREDRCSEVLKAPLQTHELTCGRRRAPSTASFAALVGRSPSVVGVVRVMSVAIARAINSSTLTAVAALRDSGTFGQ